MDRKYLCIVAWNWKSILTPRNGKNTNNCDALTHPRQFSAILLFKLFNAFKKNRCIFNNLETSTKTLWRISWERYAQKNMRAISAINVGSRWNCEKRWTSIITVHFILIITCLAAKSFFFTFSLWQMISSASQWHRSNAIYTRSTSIQDHIIRFIFPSENLSKFM